MNTKPSKYFDIIVALFVAVLLISNIASTKITAFWNFTLDAGTILFPLSYIFGDLLTEVYGYKKSRRVIWTGFFCAFLMSLIFMIVQYLPVAEGWDNQAAYESILGFIPRIVIASLIAYLAGEFSNSVILSKLKVKMKGKMLWVRTISSTLVGEGVDTIIFCLIAFLGVFPTDMLIAIIVSNYIFKCGVEIIFTPMTYKIVNFLKRKEDVDEYDYNISYNPFVTRN